MVSVPVHPEGCGELPFIIPRSDAARPPHEGATGHTVPRRRNEHPDDPDDKQHDNAAGTVAGGAGTPVVGDRLR